MDSTICLFFRKPNCRGKINLSKNGFKRKAAILDISLYTKLQRDMGLKSAKVRGISFFGMRAMKVEFKEGKTLPLSLENSTTFKRSFPRMSKKAKKNSTGHPSSLGL